MIRHCGATT